MLGIVIFIVVVVFFILFITVLKNNESTDYKGTTNNAEKFKTVKSELDTEYDLFPLNENPFNLAAFISNHDFDKKYESLMKIATRKLEKINTGDFLEADSRFILGIQGKELLSEEVAIQFAQAKSRIWQLFGTELLASGYFFGRTGYLQDYEKAYQYAKKIENFSSDARYMIGFLYFKGIYLEQNFAKAFDYFISSAICDDAEAYDLLGDMFKEGLGVTSNPALAYAFYNLACSLRPKKEELRQKRDKYRDTLSSEMINDGQKYSSFISNSNGKYLLEIGVIQLESKKSDKEVHSQSDEISDIEYEAKLFEAKFDQFADNVHLSYIEIAFNESLLQPLDGKSVHDTNEIVSDLKDSVGSSSKNNAADLSAVKSQFSNRERSEKSSYSSRIFIFLAIIFAGAIVYYNQKTSIEKFLIDFIYTYKLNENDNKQDALISTLDNVSVCQQAMNMARDDWDLKSKQYILEATKRGLSVSNCRNIIVSQSPAVKSPDVNSNSYFAGLGNTSVCQQALNATKSDWDQSDGNYIHEAMKRNLTLSDCIKIAGGSSNIANQTADNKTKAMTSSEVESIASKVSNSSVCQQALNASRTDWDINVREYILEATKRGLSVDKCRAIVSGNSLSSPSTGSNIIQNSSVITVHLTFCNRSSGTAFLAYGYGSASVRGWYPIKRDDCFLAGDLNKDDLYWYAVSENRKAWESKTDDYSWCVDLNNKFDTVRKKYCDVGEVRKSFNKIITDNSTFTMNLDEGPN